MEGSRTREDRHFVDESRSGDPTDFTVSDVSNTGAQVLDVGSVEPGDRCRTSVGEQVGRCESLDVVATNIRCAPVGAPEQVLERFRCLRCGVSHCCRPLSRCRPARVHTSALWSRLVRRGVMDIGRRTSSAACCAPDSGGVLPRAHRRRTSMTDRRLVGLRQVAGIGWRSCSAE